MNDSPQETEFVAQLTEIQLALRLYVQSLMPGDVAAHDVAQQANATLWRKRNEFAPGTNFKAWAFSVARLEAEMSIAPEARRAYLDRVALSQALAEDAKSFPATPSMAEARRGSFWLSRHPLTAAAAGIDLGMFCTSVVLGFVGQRHLGSRTPLPLMQPSFEDAQMPLAREFPPAPALWGGDEATVVPAENGVTPKHGQLMLRMEPTTHGEPLMFPRVYQVIALPPSTDELREVEVSASFASADTARPPYYSIRAYAVTQAPEQLGPDWFDHRDEAIALAATGFDSPPGSTGWQSFGLRLQVPSKARSLVVFFGVKKQDKSQLLLPHYLDAVQVSLVESTPIP